MELDAARAEIIRSLFEVDNLEALNKVKRTVVRVMKSAKAGETLAPYTVEELNERIDEAEAADAEDKLIPHTDVINRAHKFIAVL